MRITPDFPRSETNKVLKRELQREKFLGGGGADALWWRPRGAETYRWLTAEDLETLRAQFARAGNAGRLDV